MVPESVLRSRERSRAAKEAAKESSKEAAAATATSSKGKSEERTKTRHSRRSQSVANPDAALDLDVINGESQIAEGEAGTQENNGVARPLRNWEIRSQERFAFLKAECDRLKEIHPGMSYKERKALARIAVQGV